MLIYECNQNKMIVIAVFLPDMLEDSEDNRLTTFM